MSLYGPLDNFDHSVRLVCRIRSYWAARGVSPKMRIDSFELGNTHLFAIRSDMVNGFPRGLAPRKAGHV